MARLEAPARGAKPLTPRSRPSFVEIAGPAGTGKSSVVEALVALHSPKVRIVRARERVSIHRLLKNLLIVSRPFVHQYRRMGKRRWNRLSLMVGLQTLGDLIEELDGDESTIMLLDQGPVYMLSILQRALSSDGGERMGSGVFEAYWEETLSDWASRLDHVIVLEARDDILYRRVLERASEHKIKRRTRAEASAVFNQSRTSRELILKRLGAYERPPAILRLGTDQSSVQDTARSILRHLGRI